MMMGRGQNVTLSMDIAVNGLMLCLVETDATKIIRSNYAFLFCITDLEFCVLSLAMQIC